MKKILVFAMTMMCAVCAWAHHFEVDGIYYNILEDKINEVEVTYKGIRAFAVRDEYTDTVVIPSTVTYKGIIYNVTKIGNDAFNNCLSLESVTIPEGVETIGNSAFQSCYSLESVTIPGDVDEIQRDAFKNCKSLDTVMVSGKVVWYKNYAWENEETDIFFEDCTKLYICKKAFPSRTKVVSVK